MISYTTGDEVDWVKEQQIGDHYVSKMDHQPRRPRFITEEAQDGQLTGIERENVESSQNN
jgi:hypothetical protein